MVSLWRDISKYQESLNKMPQALSTPAQESRRSRLEGLPRYVLVTLIFRPLSSKAGVQFYIIARPKTTLTAISCLAILAASPIPTASEAGKVPLRKPLSCPPPLRIGSNRTRGRLLT